MSDRIVFKSVIGSHRLKSKKTPRILFPYYQNYKPVYRARNSRTPKWCWPIIDKYPYHTHQKRFPSKNNINIEFFAEFCNRSEKNRTLFELLHTLPNYGINSIVYKKRVKTEPDGIINNNLIHDSNTNENSNPDKNEKQISKCKLNINENTYIINENVQNNLFYYIKEVKYKIRPFKAKIKSDMYYNDKLIKRDISPNGAIRGIWKYSFPISSVENKHLYRPTVQPCYSDLIIGH